MAIAFIRILAYLEITQKQILDVEEVLDQYSRLLGDSFDFLHDTAALTIQDTDLEAFFKLYEDQTRQKEDQIYVVLQRFKKKVNGRYCLIAYANKKDFDHELAHALFYLNKEYRRKAEKLIKRYKCFRDISKTLKRNQYRSDSDEVNAYLATAPIIEFERLFSVNNKLEEHYELKRLFRKYKGRFLS